MRKPDAYQKAINKIVIALAKQPLARLQKLPGSSVSDSFFVRRLISGGERVSRSTLRAHGRRDRLETGVAHGLARLAGLLKPA